MNRPAQIIAPKAPSAEPGWLELVRRHVGSLRYGVVQIVVHDGHVTQIEKTERMRLENGDRTLARVAEPGASSGSVNT